LRLVLCNRAIGHQALRHHVLQEAAQFRLIVLGTAATGSGSTHWPSAATGGTQWAYVGLNGDP